MSKGVAVDERTRAVQTWWSEFTESFATQTICSPGRHHKALSRTTWLECTSQGKRTGRERERERRTAPYASTHHIIFFFSAVMNEAFRQASSAKSFHNASSIQYRGKSSFWIYFVCVCAEQDIPRVPSKLQRELW